jgi:hypothetical protein
MKITELLDLLNEKNEVLKDAIRQEQIARTACTEARNRVNELQKQIDAEMVKIKDSAEWDTDWQSSRHRGSVVSVS